MGSSNSPCFLHISVNMNIKLRNKINCWTCKYFYISWHTTMPYACRAFGFKSKNIPSLEVLSADGRSCKAYNSKAFNGFEHIEKKDTKKKKKVFSNIYIV